MIKTKTEKDMLSKEQREKRNQDEAKMRKLFVPFKGKTKGLKKLIPTNATLNAGWNIHHLFTITEDDTVYKHTDQNGVADGYVRVIYYDAKHVSVLSRNHFK